MLIERKLYVMDEKDLKRTLFENYIGSLLTFTSLAGRRENYPYKDVIYTLFKIYRENLASFGLDEQGKDRCFRKPSKDEEKEYECSQNTEKVKFPLNRILEYRNEKFPEYIDDYGMQTFIEYEDAEGSKHQIQTNDVDWDYELDRVMDFERLTSLEPKEAYNLIENDVWYKII